MFGRISDWLLEADEYLCGCRHKKNCSPCRKRCAGPHYRFTWQLETWCRGIGASIWGRNRK